MGRERRQPNTEEITNLSSRVYRVQCRSAKRTIAFLSLPTSADRQGALNCCSIISDSAAMCALCVAEQIAAAQLILLAKPDRFDDDDEWGRGGGEIE